MTTASVSKFIEAVLLHWPPFRWDEGQEKAWVAAMVRELGHFEADVLERAERQMVRTRRDTRIPTVAECVKACVEAKRWIDAEHKAASLPEIDAATAAAKGVTPGQWKGWGDYSDDRKRFAEQLIQTPDGRAAAHAGYIGSLYAFALKHGRLAKPHELAEIKRDAKGFDEAYAKVLRGDCHPMHKQPYESMGTAMLAERERLTKLVLGR